MCGNKLRRTQSARPRFRLNLYASSRASRSVGIELWLDAGEAFDRLAFRCFDFELKKGVRPVQIQNVRLSHVPKTESGSRNGADRASKPRSNRRRANPSDAAPVKGEKNRAWSDDETHD